MLSPEWYVPAAEALARDVEVAVVVGVVGQAEAEVAWLTPIRRDPA
jgi:hypothetical protein